MLLLSHAQVLAVLMSLGVQTRRCALVLYIINVSIYRWNLVIMSVDDMVTHLLLFWVLCLPSGTTLSWQGLEPDWRTQVSPSAAFTLRLALYNAAMIYIVAGATKW